MTHLQRIVESAWSNERKTFKVGGSMSRGRPTETWSEVIRSELKEGNLKIVPISVYLALDHTVCQNEKINQADCHQYQ